MDLDWNDGWRLERRVATTAEHRRLAEAVGWGEAFDWPTTPVSLHASLFGVVVLAGGEAVGMGRLVGDGVKYFYVQDVAVDPAWQACGIGQAIVEALLAWIEENAPATAFVGLFATEEAMPLYRRTGFGTEGLKGMARLIDPAGDAEYEP
jgi:GNAT superfamily N-acetyltransferase